MSRPIEFRAWRISQDGKPEIVGYYTIFDILYGKASGLGIISFDRFIGQLDKSRKKIFENDILSDGAVVEWFNKLTWDGGGSLHSGFYCRLWFLYGEDGELDYHSRLDDDVEVIGNTRENPELVRAMQ